MRVFLLSDFSFAMLNLHHKFIVLLIQNNENKIEKSKNAAESNAVKN